MAEGEHFARRSLRIVGELALHGAQHGALELGLHRLPVRPLGLGRWGAGGRGGRTPGPTAHGTGRSLR
eukprot:4502596-Alexandrium_andersonii.AAC.1